MAIKVKVQTQTRHRVAPFLKVPGAEKRDALEKKVDVRFFVVFDWFNLFLHVPFLQNGEWVRQEVRLTADLVDFVNVHLARLYFTVKHPCDTHNGVKVKSFFPASFSFNMHKTTCSITWSCNLGMNGLNCCARRPARRAAPSERLFC